MRLSALYLPLILCLSFSAMGQVQPAIFAGPQFTSAHYLIKDEKQPASYKPGFMAGAGLKVTFDQNLYFFPAIYYSRKGYKVDLNRPSFPPTEKAINNDVTVNAIEFAPLFQVDFNKRPSHLFLRFGASFDYAFSGTETFDTLAGKPSVTRPMVFSFGDYGRITAAGNIHFGYETSRGLMIFAHYAHGFGSMNNADEGPLIFHRIVGLSVGWLFGRNPNVLDTRVMSK